MPSFCSFFAIWMPISFVATKHVIPLYPFDGSTWTYTMRIYSVKACRTTYVRENEEDFGFVRVRDPHLATVNHPVVAVLLRARLQRERVGPGGGFRQAERANLGTMEGTFAMTNRSGELPRKCRTFDSASWGNHLSFCSCVPYFRKMVFTRVLCTSHITDTDGSTLASSSMTMMAEVKLHSEPP